MAPSRPPGFARQSRLERDTACMSSVTAAIIAEERAKPQHVGGTTGQQHAPQRQQLRRRTCEELMEE